MAKLNQATVSSVVLTVILIIVVFKSYAVIVPEAQAAGDEMGDSAVCADASGVWNTTSLTCNNQTGNPALGTSVDYNSVPLNGLVSTNGVVFLLVMAALLFTLAKNIMPKK